jgi:hypothetical protein
MYVVYSHTHTHVYTYMHAYTYTYMIYIYICMYLYIPRWRPLFVRIVRGSVLVYIYIYIYIYIHIGGDQCSRAVFVGACYGAALGEGHVSEAWMQKVSDLPEIDRMARLLIAPRSKL